MKMSVGEIVDKYTILKLKQENGLNVQESLKMFKQAVCRIDKEIIDQLYRVNKMMWEIEDAAEVEQDLIKLGKLYKLQRDLNKKRVEIKNMIAKAYSEQIELKKYAGNCLNK